MAVFNAVYEECFNTATSGDNQPQHGDQFEEAAELSLEHLGWISRVNTSIIHSGKVLSNQNCAHHPWLIALTYALWWECPWAFPIGGHGYGQ